MTSFDNLERFAPLFAPDDFTATERELLQCFFTNLDQSVYVPLIAAPEVIGALCSRASRAAGDLRRVFADEYLAPFLEAARGEGESDAEWQARRQYGEDLRAYINFLRAHPQERIFSNPRARAFYARWLAQYGDDSIAQMAGAHLVFSSLSQVAIKHFEDQRIGLAPIEKSTRYVDYSSKVRGQYRYYVDPTLAELGLEQDFRTAMDWLFATYTVLLPRLTSWLAQRWPDEKASVIETKAFDTLRGLLPCSTLSQVAFFGNGQAFEYLVARSARHHLREIRWAAEWAFAELSKVVPSFLRRLKDPAGAEEAVRYQEYLAGRAERVQPYVQRYLAAAQGQQMPSPRVALVEYDPEGEDKVLAGILYAAAGNHRPWEEALAAVRGISEAEQAALLAQYLAGRDQRWQKVGRAFENAYLRFDIVMNIGAWRDLHRHRMLTQQRQQFTVAHGYDLPPEVAAAGLTAEWHEAMKRAEAVYERIAAADAELAQYAVTLAHRVRFMQWTNVRECFWEMELRTIPEGHPDYRHIEQEKFRLFEQAYPLLARHARVNLGEYDFARRGQEEKIQAKLAELTRLTS